MSDKPVKKFRLGYVTANVWKNDGQDRVFYTVDLQRSYKDGTEWKSTGSMNHHDLLNAAKVLERAEEWIAQQ